MTVFRTALTRLLGIRTPIVSAAMARASGGRLAAEVTKAGGFGFMSAGYDNLAKVKQELAIARSILPPDSPMPLNIGVGFLGWVLEQKVEAVEVFEHVLEYGVKAVWLAFGNDLGKWISLVRKYDEEHGRVDELQRTLIVVQVNSVEEAVIAANKWKVDVLVLQGLESGGHGAADALPLITLIPAVLKAVPSSIPVLAAGGLSNGAHLASVLTLGASGAAIGTRFLFTPESVFSDKKKQTLLRASVASTVRSSAFDEVTESAWPKGVDARGLRNEVVEDEVQGLGLDERKKRWKAGADGSHEIIFSGSSVGLVNEIMPAADIVREIHSDAVKSLQTAFDLLAESSEAETS